MCQTTCACSADFALAIFLVRRGNPEYTFICLGQINNCEFWLGRRSLPKVGNTRRYNAHTSIKSHSTFSFTSVHNFLASLPSTEPHPFIMNRILHEETKIIERNDEQRILTHHLSLSRRHIWNETNQIAAIETKLASYHDCTRITRTQFHVSEEPKGPALCIPFQPPYGIDPKLHILGWRTRFLVEKED